MFPSVQRRFVGCSVTARWTWRTFLRAHWHALFSADFFTTEVWTVRALVTYNVPELQNVMAGVAVSASPRGQAKPVLLPPLITGAPAASTTQLAEAGTSSNGGSPSSRWRVARDLRLSRQGLLKLLTRPGICAQYPCFDVRESAE
jgi:hypothetical protein